MPRPLMRFCFGTIRLSSRPASVSPCGTVAAVMLPGRCVDKTAQCLALATSANPLQYPDFGVILALMMAFGFGGLKIFANTRKFLV
jgi:hypothetical protein